MPENNDGILLLLGSGLLIATYFATKETKRDEDDEGWPDMPEMEMEGQGEDCINALNSQNGH